MSKVNIQPIEDGLNENEVVSSQYDIGDKTLFLIATYDESVFNRLVKSEGDPVIQPNNES